MTFLSQNINIEKNFLGYGLISIYNKGECWIGEDFYFNVGKKFTPIGGDIICRLIILNKGILKIGKNVGISNSTIFTSKEIIIGDNVLIGGGCRIWDTDFHTLDPYIRIKEQDNNIISKPVKIENNVFIGGGSIILKGVNIGKNSIIGAGSVVSKDIPANEIWAGNPVKFIKKVTISNEF